MDMEEIFQELILSVGLSVAVWYMIMKLQSHVDEEKVETCTESMDGVEKDVLHEQKSDKQPLVYDIGKSRRPWPFAEFFEKLSVENIYENHVICSSELTSGVVEEAALLQDLNRGKESVGGEKTNCFGNGNSNVSDGNEVISEIVEDVVVSEELKEGEKIVCGEDGVQEEAVYESSKRSNLGEIEVESANPLEKRLESKIESELSEGVEVRETKYEEVSGVLSEDGKENERDVLKKGDQGAKEAEEEEGLFDDWEGIERTELEKLFGAAVAFVGSKRNIGLIDRDLKIQMYGLHKIAIEGPCQGPQPMALKVSARAKWNSWRRLGNMNREAAMEQYLTLLSKSIPGWKIDETLGYALLVHQKRSQ